MNSLFAKNWKYCRTYRVMTSNNIHVEIFCLTVFQWRNIQYSSKSISSGLLVDIPMYTAHK